MIYESNEQICKELKKLMIEIGVSQKQLAESLKMSPQCLQGYLAKKQLCFADMKRILECLGYDLVFDFKKKENAQSEVLGLTREEREALLRKAREEIGTDWEKELNEQNKWRNVPEADRYKER